MARRGASGVIIAKSAPPADYGPGVRWDRKGRLVNWGGSADVMLETRNDPDKPERQRLVRGARRRNALYDLHQRQVITKRMYDAGEKFLDDCSIASGASAGAEIGGIPSVAGPRTGLPERQVKALVRVQKVRHLLGLHQDTVLWHVLFNNGSLTDYETKHRLRNGTATEMLKVALDNLDLHYHGHYARNQG